MNEKFLSSKNLVSTYKENQNLISELKQLQDEFRLENNNQSSKIRSQYYKKMKALEKEENKLLNDLENKMREINTNYNNKISELSISLNKVKRIIYFQNQSKIELNFDVTKTTNRDRYLELIGQYKEPFNIHLALYIAENNRPKNKYSLIIVGMCRFGDHSDSKILKLPYDYGCDLSHSEIQWFDIAKIVKCFDSIETAKKYCKTHYIQTMLRSFFQEYSQIDTEYTKAISHYSLEDFAEIRKGEGD